ncbi:MAG: hypothetical protein J6J33_05510 [Clostridia bacterium]|nr:hypothetical protein [Clostridia bacterium]
MKKIFCLFSIFFYLLCFCACSSNNSEPSANATNYLITSKICEVDGYKLLSTETIKALAVVFRTNIKNGENYSFNKNSFDNEVFSIVSSTENEIIEDVDEIIQIENNDTWKTEIPKSKILETFSQRKENISSFGNISLERDSFGRVSKVIISQKELNKKDLKNNLLLKSNNITDIKTTQENIIFYGTGTGFGEEFNILKAEELSKNNKSYDDIINYLKISYKTIK